MQLLGVYDEYLVVPLAQVLVNLGVRRGMVVYGQDKLDEISMSSPTTICEIKDGWYKSYTICPEDFGFKTCKKDDILIGRYGASVGKILTGEEGAYNVAIMKTIPDESIISKDYAKLFFQSPSFQHFLQSVCNSRAAQAGFSKSDISDYLIPIPSLGEQERIVAELDLLQGIIEKKKEQLKAYDQLAKSIFYDTFGDPFSNEKGWEMSCFGNIMTPAKSNKCKSHSELPILSITMHDGIVRQNERFKKVIASKDVTGYKIIKRGQLVIAFPIDEGLIYTQDIEDEGIMSPAYNVWDVDYKKVQTLFLKFHLHSSVIMKYYKDKLRGTTLRRRMIPKEDLLNLPIPLPPISQQEEFAEKVEAIERQKALVQQSVEEVQTMFDCTMDKYFG